MRANRTELPTVLLRRLTIRPRHDHHHPPRGITGTKGLNRQPPASSKLVSLRVTVGIALHTTMGTIRAELYPSQTPKAVQNFLGLVEQRYYDGLTFHRVVQGFMIQTGDPSGAGSGGTSIWGRPFSDEIVPGLTHAQPYVVSMANAGPNTNGSQFFITVSPQPHLDGKHTVFGRVVSGKRVVDAISNVPVDANMRPKSPVKLVSVVLEAAAPGPGRKL